MVFHPEKKLPLQQNVCKNPNCPIDVNSKIRHECWGPCWYPNTPISEIICEKFDPRKDNHDVAD